MTLSKLTLFSVFVALATASLSAETYGDLKAPVAGKVLETAIHTKDAEELRYVILKKLLDVYAKEKGIAVTKEETTAYQTSMKEFMRKDRAAKEAARDELKRKLAAAGPSDRERLEAELKQAEEFLASASPASSAESDEDKQARDQIARSFILQWKINQALYKQYGGRIGFQQAGPEPLDAIRKFLQERKERGDFSIADKDLETAFWSYFSNDAIHQFYKPGSEEEKQAFATPPWAVP